MIAATAARESVCERKVCREPAPEDMFSVSSYFKPPNVRADQGCVRLRVENNDHLQIFWFDASVLCYPSKHLWADLFSIVKCKDNI